MESLSKPSPTPSQKTKTAITESSHKLKLVSTNSEFFQLARQNETGKNTDEVSQSHRPLSSQTLPPSPRDPNDRSVEVFFGNLTSLGNFCNSICGGRSEPRTRNKSKKKENDEIKQDSSTSSSSTSSNKAIFMLRSSYDCPRPISVAQLARTPDFNNNIQDCDDDNRSDEEEEEDDYGESDSSFLEDEDDDDDESSPSSEDISEPEPNDNFQTNRNDNSSKQGKKIETSNTKEKESNQCSEIPKQVDASSVKKLCLVGHPLTSFKGLDNFKKLHEAWITNCNIKDLRWEDFKSLKSLQRLYLFSGQIATIEPLYFQNLRVLWLSNNKIGSLSFLTDGMPHLIDLNVASNQIAYLHSKDLAKCRKLQILNVSGNPLCSIQDIEAVNSLPSLKELYLTDPAYGKCPVASMCESRTFLVARLTSTKLLVNGKIILPEERNGLRKYLDERCLYYYSNAVASCNSNLVLREVATQTVKGKLEIVGNRIAELLKLASQCLQADYQMGGLSAFSKIREQLVKDAAGIQTRISQLREWSRIIMKKIDVMHRVARWEQQLEQWIKWVEFKSFGTIDAYIAYSSLDETKDTDGVRNLMHQTINVLSCKKPWPPDTLFRLDTVVIIKDRASETGLEKLYDDEFATLNEPKFIPPPPLEDEPMVQPVVQCGQAFYGPPPLTQMRIESTYIDPNYRPPPPVFPYPESVPGLPERSQPLLLFLITRSKKKDVDAMAYFQDLLFSKSSQYKNVRVTNCVWTASRLNHRKSKKKPERAVLILLKVLEECLIPIGKGKNCGSRHSDKCLIFGLNRPHSFAPAFILNLAYIPKRSKKEKEKELDFDKLSNDRDIIMALDKTLQAIEQVYNRTTSENFRQNCPYYLYRTHDGVKAELTAVTRLVGFPRGGGDSVPKQKNIFELTELSKFFGETMCESITSLSLCYNDLVAPLIIDGLLNLKKLNLSHNNLASLGGLPNLPNLKEFHLGWNSLRYFFQDLNILATSCNNLEVLDLLPNTFQDIRSCSHVPFLAYESLPSLRRVDCWEYPFKLPPKGKISKSLSLFNIGTAFSIEVYKATNGCTPEVSYLDYSGRCSTNLEWIPLFPEHNKSLIYINLSDNYLTSASLTDSNLVRNAEWRNLIFKLELQENVIMNLDWMIGHLFPCLKFLNVANNFIEVLDPLPDACLKLQHLHMSGNPLKDDIDILDPLKGMKELITLDASRTSVSRHPKYASFVIGNLPGVQLLDGIAVKDWNSEEPAFGGVLSLEWLEAHMAPGSWINLTQLSLPYCGIFRAEVLANSLSKLMSLDLSNNNLYCLGGLTNLPNLRVLNVSSNYISSLGEVCPFCYERTVEQQLLRSPYQPTVPLPISLTTSSSKSHLSSLHLRLMGATDRQRLTNQAMAQEMNNSLNNAFAQLNKQGAKYPHMKYFMKDFGLGGIVEDKESQGSDNAGKIHFPKLETLILSHNGISTLEYFHFHAYPNIRTLILNCNKIKTLDGLDNIPSLENLILDSNLICQMAYGALSGCKSLRNLHLDYNKISSIPRPPHLPSLMSLHIAFNRIHSLDIRYLGQLELHELSISGNPACKGDYWKNVLTQLPFLQKLDGINVAFLRSLCHEGWLSNPSFSYSGSPKHATEIGNTTDCSGNEWFDDVEELPPAFLSDEAIKAKVTAHSYLHGSLESEEE